jgi:hypothetical protein
MVNAGCKVDLRGLEGIVGGEVDGQEEDAALEWTITLRQNQKTFPGCEINPALTGPMIVACQ